MKNPAAVLPGAWQAIVALGQASEAGGVPADTLELVHLRVSQINGCSACAAAAAKSTQSPGAARHGRGLARGPVLHRCRARRPRPRRGRHPPGRQPRPGPRRDLGRGGQALRRAGHGLADPVHRRHQRLQPPQPRHPAASGRLVRTADQQRHIPNEFVLRVPRTPWAVPNGRVIAPEGRNGTGSVPVPSRASQPTSSVTI
ncbi:MAG: carboxymuconolactone decarboxylase family protein [Trebonia sp.]